MGWRRLMVIEAGFVTAGAAVVMGLAWGGYELVGALGCGVAVCNCAPLAWIFLVHSGRIAPVLVDAGPFCGECKYRLEDAGGGRCPECGAAFAVEVR